MTGRQYNQFCLMAQCLDVIGNRWAVLIVRELYLGPRRFSDIVEALGTASTDIVTTRLRELEDNAVIAERPGRNSPYELTDSGRALAPVLLSMAVWTLQHATGGHVAFPAPAGDTSRRLLTTLALKASTTSFADGGNTFGLRIDPHEAVAEPNGDHYRIKAVDAPHPDPIELTTVALGQIAIGGADIDDLIERDMLRISNSSQHVFLADLNHVLGQLPDVWAENMKRIPPLEPKVGT